MIIFLTKSLEYQKKLMEMYMTDWIHLSVFDTLKHEYKTLTWMGRILSSDEAQNIYEIIGTEFNSAES